MGISAFGVDHGDIEKRLNPIKALKGKGAKIAENSRNKNFQRGYNQQMRAHGAGGGTGASTTPTFGSLMPGMKRSHNSYSAGQLAGRKAATREPLPDPFR